MNKYKGEFHRWIMEEWYRKNGPEVLNDITRRKIGQKRGSMMRLWTHECGQFYFREAIYNCDKHKQYVT